MVQEPVTTRRDSQVASADAAGEQTQGIPHADIIKRFIKTPFETLFRFGSASIRLETNYQAVADRLRSVLAPPTAGPIEVPDLVLRVVAEFEEEFEPQLASGIRYGGLSFVSLDQNSFIAFDHEARKGMAFIPHTLVADEKQFSQYFVRGLIWVLRESFEDLS